MENKEDNFNDVVSRLESWAFRLEPSLNGWQSLLDKLAVTEEGDNRFHKQKVNIISPFYNFMSNTGKVLSVMALVAVLAIGGVIYYQMAVPVGEEVGSLASNFKLPTTKNSGEAEFASVVGEPVAGLLALLNEELDAETSLLASEGNNFSNSLEEELLADLNKYENEI